MNQKKAKLLRKVSKAMARAANKPERQTIEQTVAVKSLGQTRYNTVTVNKPDTARAVYRKMKTDYNNLSEFELRKEAIDARRT